MNIVRIQILWLLVAKPRYYAMYDGGSGTTDGYWKIAPAPDAAYTVEAEYLKMPTGFKWL